MKGTFSILFIIFSTSCFSQQFDFNQLISMLTNKSLFEQNMIKAGNDALGVSESSYYLCKRKFEPSRQLNFIDDDEFILDSSMLEVTRTTKSFSSFAENFRKNDEKASTFYDLYIKKSKQIRGKTKLGGRDEASLTIQYARSSDYSRMLKVITSKSKYIKTQKNSLIQDSDSFFSIYQYGSIKIAFEKKQGPDSGGSITLSTDLN